MPIYQQAFGTLTIASGGTTSGVVRPNEGDSITIFAPSSLTGTITVEIEPTATGTSFCTLTSGGSNVTIAASAALIISPANFGQLRLKSGSTELADRTFTLVKGLNV